MRTKCKPTKTYDQKFLSSEDPLSQFVRIQYGASDRGMVSLRNIIDTFAGLDEAISDLGSTSENEAIEEDNDNNNSGNDDEDDHDSVVEEENDNSNNSNNDDDEDDHVVEEESTSQLLDKCVLKKTESDTKRKSSEAGCSEENKTSPENTKRMRMNTPSSVLANLLNGQPTHSGDFCESSDSSESDDDLNDSDNWMSSEENDHNDDDFSGIYNSLVNGEDNYDSDTDSEVASELILYRFLSERKDNEFSKLLKGKIDLLPVPTMLKLFLNYNKED